MALTFRCKVCKKRFFFSSYTTIDNTRICRECGEKLKQRIEEKKREKKQKQNEREIRKAKERRIKQGLANEQLKKEIEERNRTKNKIKSDKKRITKDNEADKNKEEDKNIPVRKPKSVPLEKQAETLSQNYDSVLYLYCDVKRIKAVEWKRGKKRVALNKEREVRRTHKGGWSQEKFQKFVAAKKRTAPDWVTETLSRGGVLRPPYDKIIIECRDDEIKESIEKYLKQIEY